ncbi:MAG: Sulfatase [Nitrospira sp.]|jgi:phosphoglycerol transferase MdoB-like AlkP superfamily enzyme|nr:MAG: Sulfatase [Nitrospira sp.]
MMARWTEVRSSIRKSVLFWWILFVVMQTAERVFLLRDAIAQETPTFSLLLKTLAVGVRGDFITATFALLLGLAGAGAWALLINGWSRWRRAVRPFALSFTRALHVGCSLSGLVLFLLLCVDMGYYGFNRQHMDFVFLEYLGDLVSPAATPEETNVQAVKQTGAELEAGGKWATRVALFLAVQAIGIGLWWWTFSAAVVPALSRWRLGSGFQANALLCLCLVGGGAGFHPSGPYGIRIAHIGSTVYYTLAQNPILFASEALRVAWVSRGSMERRAGAEAMPYEEAVRTAQRLLGPDELFADQRYPLVRSITVAPDSIRLSKPANVMIIFLEGLDRRYLGQGYGEVRGTPFLDRLKDDSVFFENFFSNGVQTSRGLFATLCSTYPRHGASAMKTRYAHDYLCLPSLLQRRGYSTDMVIGQHRDLNRLQTFLSRNGLQQLLDESDFPPDAERAGLGIVDGALFDLCYERIKRRQAEGRPFFLATLTLTTHHPFTVPARHPEVRTLQQQVQDQYVAALRYTDLELERVFTKLVREGLLRNTVVVVLGDHGRHEPIGSTDVERKAGHFASPLLIWMDESLRAPATYRPRTVSTVASQVDIAPTLLALNGLLPAVAPFAGRDLTCTLVHDCLPDHVAYLTSVYDNLVGLAGREGLLLYSFLTETFQEAGLDFAPLPDHQEGERRLAALPLSGVDGVI